MGVSNLEGLEEGLLRTLRGRVAALGPPEELWGERGPLLTGGGACTRSLRSLRLEHTMCFNRNAEKQLAQT